MGAVSGLENSHNWPVYGHDWAVQQLRRSIMNGRVRHAYLITGTESIGKNTFAHAFAMALNCTHADEAGRPCGACRSCRLIFSGNHPDILYSDLDPNTGALRIETVRAVTRSLAMKPFEARYRIAILGDFDHALARAQDALLKTLEEPPPSAVLILLAPSTDVLLPTIVSRCQTLALTTLPLKTIYDVLVDLYGASAERAELLARLSAGRLGWAINALHDETLLSQRDEAFAMLSECLRRRYAGRFAMAEGLARDKLSLLPLLELWQTYWRDVLLMAQGAEVPPANSDRLVDLQRHALHLTVDEALRALKATRRLIDQLNANINVRLALEVMFLDYPKVQ